MVVDERRRELGRQQHYLATLHSHIHATEQAHGRTLPADTDYNPKLAHIEAYQRHSDKLLYQNQMLRLHEPQAQGKVDVARHDLAAARLSARAVEELLAERARTRLLHTERRQQHALDDIARGLLLRRAVHERAAPSATATPPRADGPDRTVPRKPPSDY